MPKYYQLHDAPCRLDVVSPVDSEMRSMCGKDVKLTGKLPASCSGPGCGSLSEAFGASLAAHLSSLSESYPGPKFLAALAELANTHPQDVGENQVYEVF